MNCLHEKHIDVSIYVFQNARPTYLFNFSMIPGSYLASFFHLTPDGYLLGIIGKKRADPELKAQNWAHLQLCLVGPLFK